MNRTTTSRIFLQRNAALLLAAQMLVLLPLSFCAQVHAADALPRHDESLYGKNGYTWSPDMNVKDGVHFTDAAKLRVAKELTYFQNAFLHSRH